MKLKITKKGLILATTPVLLSILIIVARYTIFRTMEEIQRAAYINAATELSCESLKNPLLSVDKELGAQKTKEIFAKYGFKIGDNEEMLAITEKYGFNESTAKKITNKLSKTCVILPE